jgi:hypothetical protein
MRQYLLHHMLKQQQRYFVECGCAVRQNTRAASADLMCLQQLVRCHLCCNGITMGALMPATPLLLQ